MTPSDTSPAMADEYYRRLAELTPSQRTHVSLALWDGRTGHSAPAYDT